LTLRNPELLSAALAEHSFARYKWTIIVVIIIYPKIMEEAQSQNADFP
jgi:hypothetical protein